MRILYKIKIEISPKPIIFQHTLMNGKSEVDLEIFEIITNILLLLTNFIL